MLSKEVPTPNTPQNAWFTLHFEHLKEKNSSERQERDILLNTYPRDPLYKAVAEFTRTVHGAFDKLDDDLGERGFRIRALFIVYGREEIFVTMTQLVTLLRELGSKTLAPSKPNLLRLGTNRVRVEFEDSDAHGCGGSHIY